MKRSRNSNVSIKATPVVIDEPSERIETICRILYWHKFLPSHWVRHHFPTALKNQAFITTLGTLREEQNAYIKWSAWPLNVKAANNRHGIYELALKGARLIDVKLPTIKDQDVPHDFIVSLHEAALKFHARAVGKSFEFIDERPHYKLPSGKVWEPDGHTIIVNDDTIIHSEIERRKWKESPEDTEEKLEKAHEYVKSGIYKEDAPKALCLFLSTTQGRTNALKQYTADKFGNVSFFLFGTTKDWVREAPLPDPTQPLVLTWARVGHDPIDLFQPATKGGAI